MKLYSASQIFAGFEYPTGLEKIVDLGLIDLDTRLIMDALEEMIERSKEEESYDD